MMYMRESRREVPVNRVPFALRLAIAVCMAATIYLGIFPDGTLRYAQDSAQRLILQAQPQIPASLKPNSPETL
jgi:NADH:ubiquinone oxidoreductase subunit 2 (subunit N)